MRYELLVKRENGHIINLLDSIIGFERHLQQYFIFQFIVLVAKRGVPGEPHIPSIRH